MAEWVSNFILLESHSPELARLALKAEMYFTNDPNTCLIKIRQVVEALAKQLCQANRVMLPMDPKLVDYTRELHRIGLLSDQAKRLCDLIRRKGNEAVHATTSRHKEAAESLRHLRGLVLWYEDQFGNPDAKVGPFQLPPAPKDSSAEIQALYDEQQALEQRLQQSHQEREQYEQQLADQAALLQRPRVWLHDDMLTQLGSLAEELQERLHPPIGAFRDDPSTFELATFGEVVDDKFRWVALTDDHIMVVAVSPTGTELCCFWVDELEAAGAWVRTRRLDVHPDYGNLQIYPLPEEAPVEAPRKEALFGRFTDEQLRSIGLPPLLLPSIRALTLSAELDLLAVVLPPEAAEGLRALHSGQSPEDIQAASLLGKGREPVDTTDFEVALGHAASQRSFAAADDEETLAAMLKAPLSQWRVYLHPSQRRVVETRAKGPVRVLGGAGTGKTVALLHRTVHLLRHQSGPDDRLLVTTYTKNLAADLETQLGKLLTPEEMSRVDVTHLYSWAASYLRKRGARLRVVQKAPGAKYWKAAIPLGPDRFKPAFYKEEWEKVIQAQGVREKAEYWYARRRGRGTRLNRKARSQVWEVFAAYRASLDKAGEIEWPNMVRMARVAVEETGEHPYRAVLVDEVQDFKAEDLRLLRALARPGPGDMFLAGDAHQRIYGLSMPLSKCGIAIRGRSFRLKINYRTTQRIQELAMGVLDGTEVDDLDDGVDTLNGYQSLRTGLQPEVHMLADAEAEYATMVETVRGWMEEGPAEAICVTARSGWLLKKYAAALGAAGIETVALGGKALALLGPGVRVSTMHRLKGMEFSRMLLVGVQKGTFPLPRAVSKFGDEASEEDFLQQERCLFYVAATRARDALVVTGHGERSVLLGEAEAC